MWAALFGGCKKSGCFEKAGAVIKIAREVKSFNQIDIRDNIHLVLTQDTIERIFVEGGEHILPNITTTFTDGILYIRNNTDCKWMRKPSEKLTVYVSVKDLIRVIYNSSGNVTSTNTITADAITFTTDEGAGNMNIDLIANRTFIYIYTDNADAIFRGRSDSCYAYTGERGTLDLRNFVVKDQTVGYGSIRDGYVHATDSLHVIMYFKGTLFYRGAPQKVTVDYQSSGQVLPMP